MDGLLLHDGVQNIDLIRSALADDECRLEAIESTTAALKRIRVGVGIVLVAVASIDDERVQFAERLRADGLFSGALLLLCRGRQSSDAFRLCKEGVFEDYVTVDPLQVRHGERTRSALGSIGVQIGLARSGARGAAVDLDRQADGLLRSLVALMDSGSWRSEDIEERRRDQILEEMASLRTDLRDAFASLVEGLTGAEASVRSVGRSEPVRVLLVDDDPAAYELVRDVIDPIGYAVTWVDDPRATVEIAREVCPQAILLDLEMPSLSGLEVLRHIRHDPALRDTPVLLLTGRSDRPTVMTAREIGFEGYLLKPPKRVDLVNRLAQLVAQEARRRDPGSASRHSTPFASNSGAGPQPASSS